MPRLILSLEQQFSDLRSNELAYLFKVENQGANAIELFAVTPRIPEKVELVEVKSPSVSAARSKYDDLCTQLSMLLEDFVLANSQKVREQLIQIDIDAMKEVIGSAPAIVRSYFWMFSGQFTKNLKDIRVRSKALVVNIENKRDANAAFSRFFSAVPDDEVRKQVFVSKIEQLIALEEVIGTGPSAKALATVEPDSFFAITYILRFPRSTANPKKYNLAIEAAYSEVGKNEKYVGGATTSLIVSPRAELLSMIAIVASLLGVVLRLAANIPGSDKAATTLRQILWGPVIPWQALAGAILALVFFNVYEFTTLGDKFKMTVSWRSALLIGFLCGIGQDRILASIKTFIGA